MDISTISTNFYGLLPDVRVVTLDEWSDKYFRPVKTLVEKTEIKEARGIAAQWTIHLKTNNEHIYSFFRENFAPASLDLRPDIFCYAFTEINDEGFLKAFHDALTTPGMERLINETSQHLSLRTYREGLADQELLGFDKLSPEDKARTALRKPTAMYVPEFNIFITINVDCYQVLRNQGCFGVLKRLVLSRIPLKENGALKDPSSVWVPLNASAIQLPGKDDRRSGIAFLSADPTLKSSLAIMITDEIADAEFISSDLVYVNAGSRKMMAIEGKPYVPGTTIARNLELLPSALSHGFENLRLDAKTAESLDRLDPSLAQLSTIHRVLPQDALATLRKHLLGKGVFAILDPIDFWPKAKVCTSARLDTLFLIKQDYDDNRVVAPISTEEAMALLTAENNVPVYEETRVEGSHPSKLHSLTVPWFDNHFITPLRGPKKWEVQKQEVLMKGLMSGDLNICLLNARIPFNQLLFCTIDYILGEVNSVEVTTQEYADRILCAKLKLFRKTRKKDEISVPCLFSPDGREVNILSFTKPAGMTYCAAFDARGEERNQVKSYSRGTVADFFKLNPEVPARAILRQSR